MLSCINVSNLFAQIINNQINYEIRPGELYYNGVNDGGSGPGEPEIKIDIRDPNGQWYRDQCISDISSPSVPFTWTNNDPSRFYLWGTNWPWTSTFDFYVEVWEDDNGGACDYTNSGNNPDDDYYAAYATYTDPNATETSISQNAARWSSAWYSNDNNNTGGWLLPNSNIWDIKLKTAWRYTSGDNCSDPLDFGTLNDGQQYIHYNNTSGDIENEHSGNAPLTYTNNDYATSRDIYYKFTLSQTSHINVNTISSQFTNFDTYLRLIEDDCSTVIASNDDAGNGVLQSEIIQTLGPGTYIIMVEGYTSYEGTLRLSLQANSTISSLSDYNSEIKIEVYPNPAVDHLNINMEDTEYEDYSMRIIDLSGKTIKQEIINGGINNKISMGDVKAGSYLIEIDLDGEKLIERFVKN